ncbi:hypothetical protein DY000_02045423 [Brassica cretica]|uniref:NB-ARC domain-containing protein n=1 Tax=Brassica cretica TaxID=69181 RepID=A0ABQ7F169_BRACR|nr:hypothetical protein DY000_02045423 [Brassica cretica]
MGGCASVSVSCDQTLNQVGRCLTENANHIHNKLDENVETLQVSTQELKVLRDDLLTRVFLEEEKGHRRLATVQRWFSNVETVESQVNELLAEGAAEIFSEFRIQKAMAEKVCSSLMEDEVGTLGLYGMGGVGKTTLLTQINNIFVNTENDFDVVIWVVVSKDQKMESVQETILWRLGRFSEEWKHLNEEEKASEIKQVLKGVPLPTRMNRCKVLFTTRSKEVCSEMRVDVEMEVKCLAPDEAWELFRMRAGDLTLESHPDIPGVARKIAGKCYGLPLALNVIGK